MEVTVLSYTLGKHISCTTGNECFQIGFENWWSPSKVEGRLVQPLQRDHVKGLHPKAPSAITAYNATSGDGYGLHTSYFAKGQRRDPCYMKGGR